MNLNKKSKFEISNIKILSAWCYDLKSNQDCTICRCNLNCSSIYANEKGIDSVIVSGVCSHTFHNECISSWIQINNVCPICFVKWTPNNTT
jgi:hypothetical protein